MNKILSFTVILLIASATIAQDELFIDNKKFFKGMDQVNLAEFTVSFTTSEAKTASTQSRTNFSGAKSALKVETNGLSKELMQKITNEAYADFISKLEAKGFDVSRYVVEDKVKKNMLRYIKRTENFAVDVDHYQAFSAISTITASPNGQPFIIYKNQSQVGLAAKESGGKPINVNYIINSGYIQANANTAKNSFMNEIYTKTKVAFLPGIQVWWRSGIEGWEKPNKKAELKINKHIYVESGAPGELITKNKTDLGRYGRATLEIKVDPDKYYTDAMNVLKQANTKLIDALDDAR
ncbi:hypothetical protein [Ekhidna sp.]|uniref:hypothetical protein n=1 Tax=Ekhidna sp. TaxID=2608089 RepID=UPI003C7B6FD0